MKHMPLRHIVVEASGEAWGGKQTRVRVFLGIISAQKVFYEDIPTCASLELVEKGGANAGPGEVVKSCKSAGPSAVLDGGYAARISADGFAQVEECAVEPASAAGGVAQVGVGASTAERMHMLLGAQP